MKQVQQVQNVPYACQVISLMGELKSSPESDTWYLKVAPRLVFKDPRGHCIVTHLPSRRGQGGFLEWHMTSFSPRWPAKRFIIRSGPEPPELKEDRGHWLNSKPPASADTWPAAHGEGMWRSQRNATLQEHFCSPLQLTLNYLHINVTHSGQGMSSHLF